MMEQPPPGQDHGLKKDQVCGRLVNVDKARTTQYGDRPYYFCSQKCELDFVQNPLRYVDKSKSASSTEGSPKITAGGEIERSKS